MIKIDDLMSITLATKNLEQSTDFYENSWGLFPSNKTNDSAIFRGANSSHHLLELVRADETKLHKVTFTLGSVADVDQAARILAKKNAAGLTQPAPRQAAGGGYGFTVEDPDGNVLELTTNIQHIKPLDETDRIQQISHLVLNTPNLTAMKSFYTEVLGFSLSDWYENEAFLFLRCNSAHHRIVLAPADSVGINHIAFDVSDCDAMMRTVGRMKKSGYEPVWGPGRHGPGGNTFCYFADPNGYVIEVSSDLIEISNDESWVAQEWQKTPDNADVWGTSGGPSQQAIQLMQGHREGFQLKKRN